MDELLGASGLADIEEQSSTVPFPDTRAIDVHNVGPQDRAEIGDHVRQAMRGVPNSAVIITSTDIRRGGAKYRGATVSSFNTVTIEPTTIVSVNIKRPSATWDAILSSQYFLVHLLNATESAGTVASAFSKGVTSTPFRDLFKFRLEANPVHLPMKRANQLRGRPPMLSGAKGLNRSFGERFLCRGLLDKTVEVGDHIVVFGIVERVIPAPSIANQTQRNGLAYVNGQYGQIIELDPDESLAEMHASVIIKPPRRPKRRVRMAVDIQPQELMTDNESAAFSQFLWKIQTMDHSTLLNVQTMSHFTKKLDAPIWQSGSELVAAGFKTHNTLTMQWRSLWQRLQKTGQIHQQPSVVAALIQHGSVYWSIFIFTNELKAESDEGLRQETTGLLESYRNNLLDVHRQVTSLERVLQTLYDSTALEQPPVHPLYDIRKAPAERLADRYPYLRSYFIYCLARPMRMHRNDDAWMDSLHPRITASFIAYCDGVEHVITWVSEQARALSSKSTMEGAITRLRTAADEGILLVPRSSELIHKYGHRPLIRVDFRALRRATEDSVVEYGRTCEETFAALMDWWDLVSDPYQKLGLDADPETRRASMHPLAAQQALEKEEANRPAIDIVDTGEGLRAGHIRKVAQTVVRTTRAPDDPNCPDKEELDPRKIKFKDPFTIEALQRKVKRRELSIEGELENIRAAMRQEQTKITGPSEKPINEERDVQQSVGDALEDVRKLMRRGTR